MSLVLELEKDVRVKEGLKSCINCGLCTAVCPAAQYYEYDPRIIINIVLRRDEQEIENLLKSDSIWCCGECFSCKVRCPRDNTPVLIIQSLRTLSLEKGFFIYSKKGREQVKLIELLVKNILNYGYTIYIDEINTDYFPEQGPIWDWIKKNINTLSTNIGFSYQKEGPGALRKIPFETINEINKIFEETGAINLYQSMIEKLKAFEKNIKNE